MEFGRDFDQPIGEAFELSPNVLVSVYRQRCIALDLDKSQETKENRRNWLGV